MFRLKSKLLQFIVIDVIVFGVIVMLVTRRQPLRHRVVREIGSKYSSNLPPCPLYPETLQEKLIVDATYQPTEGEAVNNAGSYVKNGCYDPPDCAANQNLAVLIPYKNRKQHLQTLMHHLHPILQRQRLRYCIFVTEQYDDGAFNKARVMNAGVLELLKNGPYVFDCLIFQDVDMLAEDDRNLYRCLRFPHHLSPAIDKFNYTVGYGTHFGGVGAMNPAQYFAINGHSNRFYGWGGEDTDLETRIHLLDIKPIPASALVGRYKMIPHEHPWSFNPLTGTGSYQNSLFRKTHKKFRLMKSTDNSGLSTIKYKVKNMLSHRLYTKFNIDVRIFIIKSAESSFDDFTTSVKVENPFFTNTGNFDSEKIVGFGIEDQITLEKQNCTFQYFPGKIIYHKPEKPKNEGDIYETVFKDLNEAKTVCIRILQNCSAVMVKSPGNYVLRPSPYMHEKVLRFRTGPGFRAKIVSTAFQGEAVFMKICEKDSRFHQFLANPVTINDERHILRAVSHRSKFQMQIFQTEEFQLSYNFTIYSTHRAITKTYKIVASDSALFVTSGTLPIFNSTDESSFKKFLGNYKSLDDVAKNEGVLEILTPPVPMTLFPGSYVCESTIIDENDVIHLKWKWWFQVQGSTADSERILLGKYLPQAKLEYSDVALKMYNKYHASYKRPFDDEGVMWSMIFSQYGDVFKNNFDGYKVH